MLFELDFYNLVVLVKIKTFITLTIKKIIKFETHQNIKSNKIIIIVKMIDISLWIKL